MTKRIIVIKGQARWVFSVLRALAVSERRNE